MAIVQIAVAQRDGLRETFRAYQDSAARVPADLSAATFGGRARHQVSGAEAALTVALAAPGDAAREHEVLVTATTANWAAGVWEAQVWIAVGGVTTSHVFEIMTIEDL